jgi:hypothetical protein
MNKTQAQTSCKIISAKPKISWWVIVIALLFIAGHVYLTARQITDLSPVGTEINHLIRGSEALLGNRDGLGRHPHPYDYVVGMQLLSTPIEHRPTAIDNETPIGQQLDDAARQWVHSGNFSNADSPLYAARYSTMLLSVLLAVIIFITSRKLWGDAGGLLSLSLYCFSPTILAHSCLATPDLANAFILVALGAWTWKTATRATRSDTPGGVWPIMMLVLIGVMQWAMASKPQPTALWAGSWYLNGQTFDQHPTGFYLYSFLIKTPVVLLVLLMVAQVAWMMRKGERRRDAQRAWPMVCIVLCTLYVAMRIEEPIGLRLLLPMYPALFVLAGSAMRLTADAANTQNPKRHNARIMCLLSATVLILQTLIFPQHFLTFTNQAARQQDAVSPHLAVDNLDWGQDYRIAAKDADYIAGFGPFAEADQNTAKQSLFQWSDKPLTGGRFVISSNYMSGATPAILPRNWTVQMERDYQRLRDYFATGLLKLPEQHAGHHAHGMTKLSHEQWMWLRLRLARICAHLRVREPDEVINKTMLVYQLSDEQVKFIMDTPPYPQKTDDGLEL